MLSLGSRRGETLLYEFPNEVVAAQFYEHALTHYPNINAQFPFTSEGKGKRNLSSVLITLTGSVDFDIIIEKDFTSHAGNLGGALHKTEHY